LACFSGNTEYAVTAKKEIGRVWNRQGAIYPALFQDTTSATRVCRTVRIYRFIDEILESNERAAEFRYSERIFYRHMRYFVMHILARKSTVLRKPELAVSEDDKLTLSREINEIATLIYNEAEAMQAPVGYLAVSRNLTWARPLADRVMQALATQEAARAQQAVAPPEAAPPEEQA
jgi:hypothetical protein